MKAGTLPVFVGKIEITFDGSMVHLVGLPDGREGTPPVAQLAMSEETFRQMLADGRRKLARMAN